MIALAKNGERQRKLLVTLLLIVSTLAVYWSVREFDFINLDDNLYVSDNPRIPIGLTRDNIIWAFTTTDVANWHPLTWLSYLADGHLYGLNPAGFHLTNLLLHLFSVALLFWTLHLMTGAFWRSALVAALFALHPLNIESVAWVGERKNVLSTVFWLLTIWAYVKYVRRPGWLRYFAVLLCFVTGLLAKPMLVTLPFLLLLLDFWPLNRFLVDEPAPAREPNGADATNSDAMPTMTAAQPSPLSPPSAPHSPAYYRRVLWLVTEKAPLFLISVASCVITVIAQQSGGAISSTVPFIARLGNAIVSYVGYIYMSIWPTHLAVFYPHPGTSLSPVKVAAAAIVMAALTAVALWQSRRRGYLAIGWLWYVGTLVPVIGLVQVGGQGMADRYAYVSLIGLFVVVAWGLAELPRALSIRMPLLAGGAVCILLVFAVNTRQQLKHWRNSITLFEHALQVTEKNFAAHNNLGTALAQVGLIDEALEQYKLSVKAKADYGEGYYNIGVTLTNQGKFDEAIINYCEALNFVGNPQVLSQTHNNVGLVMFEKGNHPEALKNYLEALRHDAKNIQAHNNLALLFFTEKKYEEAVAQYRASLAIKPDPIVYFKMGVARRDQGNLSEAAASFRQALAIAPEFTAARQELNIILEKTGRLETASHRRTTTPTPITAE